MAVGDALADFVDQGGGGGGGGGTFGLSNSGGGCSLSGRLTTTGYLPLAGVVDFYATDAMGSVPQPGHPIMSGVTSVGGDCRDQATPTIGAQGLANWTSGDPMVAVSSSGRVVGATVFPAGDVATFGPDGDTGDYELLFANILHSLGAR